MTVKTKKQKAIKTGKNILAVVASKAAEEKKARDKQSKNESIEYATKDR